jgi:hypothetical protein
VNPGARPKVADAENANRNRRRTAAGNQNFIKEQVKSFILTNDLHPGDLMPTEQQLMEQVENPVTDITLVINDAPGHREITVAVQAPTLPLVLSTIISGYTALFVTATVFVIWPLLLDPDRGLAVSAAIRLGLTVIANHPVRILALVVSEAVLIGVGVQAFVAALVLPAVGLVLASWVVLPVADRLMPPPT